MVRHQVSRRLARRGGGASERTAARGHVVVRALPPAATATSAELEKDFVTAISRVACA